MSHLRRCNTSAYVAQIIIILALTPVASFAAPPAHSPEACVCHLDGRTGGQARDGSNTTNATICVQSYNSGKHWCDITVECLRGINLPGCASRSNVIPSLPRLFNDHLQSLRSSPIGTVEANVLQGGLAQVTKLAQDPPQVLRNCIAYFEKGSSAPPISAGGLSCGVSEAHKWLFIELDVQNNSIRYLFSPR